MPTPHFDGPSNSSIVNLKLFLAAKYVLLYLWKKRVICKVGDVDAGTLAKKNKIRKHNCKKQK